MELSCLPHLQIIVLLILQRYGPLCGYRIAKMLNETLGLDIDEASVYNVLGKLARRGLVRPIRETGHGRSMVLYEVTEHGREELCKLLGVLDKINTAIGRALGWGVGEGEQGVPWTASSVMACQY